MNWPMLFKMFCVVLFAFGAGFWCAYTVYFKKPRSEAAKVREIINDQASVLERFNAQYGYANENTTGIARAIRPFGVFRSPDGGVYPPMHKWGDLPYEEIAPMFLDQFLLRYFDQVPLLPISNQSTQPWRSFLVINRWAKDLPILFQQLTGYELTERQLNWAIDEYTSRLQRAHAGKNQPVETAETSANIKA